MFPTFHTRENVKENVDPLCKIWMRNLFIDMQSKDFTEPVRFEFAAAANGRLKYKTSNS